MNQYLHNSDVMFYQLSYQAIESKIVESNSIQMFLVPILWLIYQHTFWIHLRTCIQVSYIGLIILSLYNTCMYTIISLVKFKQA